MNQNTKTSPKDTAASVNLTLEDVDLLDEAIDEWMDDTQLSEEAQARGQKLSSKINGLREWLLFN